MLMIAWLKKFYLIAASIFDHVAILALHHKIYWVLQALLVAHNVLLWHLIDEKIDHYKTRPILFL